MREHGYVSTHRPGHQIGLNVHEPYGSYLNYGKENSSTLKFGNVVTWEPGIGYPDKKLPLNRFGWLTWNIWCWFSAEARECLEAFRSNIGKR